MAILGLIGTEAFKDQRFKSVRRKVFYDYPNGAAPMTGITSILKEEAVSDPEYKIHEKRLIEQRTTTASIAGGKGPFAGSGAAVANSWGATLRTGGAGIDAGGANTVQDKISMKVADTSGLRFGHILEVKVTLTGGSEARLLLRVAQIGAAARVEPGFTTPASAAADATFVDCYMLNVMSAGLINDASAANASRQVLVVGSAYKQASLGSGHGAYTLPSEIWNYCQIFKTPISISGTAAKVPATFDSGGIYEDRSKDAAISHMIELEKAFIFGVRSKDGDANTPTYTTGGILWYLEQYELTVSNPYGITHTGTMDDDNDGKRIIANSTGFLSEKKYDGWVERCFRCTNNKANEKLVLCGSGFLNVINQLYKSKSVLNSDLPLVDTYGMDVVKHRSPFGTLYYKTHPLFTQNAILRNCALILDVGNMTYRYVTGRDTELLENRQENNADYRLDEWLTECGLELEYPESCMFIQNVLDYSP